MVLICPNWILPYSIVTNHSIPINSDLADYGTVVVDRGPVDSVGLISVWTGIGNFGARYVNGNKKSKGCI